MPGKRGRKPKQSTELSEFLEKFFLAADAAKRYEFAFDVFVNLTSPQKDYNLNQFVCPEYKATIGTYVSGNQPNPEFLKTISHCVDLDKFNKWVCDTFPDYLNGLCNLAKEYQPGATAFNVGKHLGLIIQRILRKMGPHADAFELILNYDPMSEEASFDSKGIAAFRNELLAESGFKCEFCGQGLLLQDGTNDGHVMIIDPAKKENPTLNDVILVCSKHFHQFCDKPSEERAVAFRKAKDQCARRHSLDQAVLSESFDDRICDLLRLMEATGFTDPQKIEKKVKLRMKPKKVDEKLPNDPILASVIKGVVLVGYPRINTAFETLEQDQQYSNLSELMRLAIRTAFINLKEISPDSKEDIFLALIQTVMDATHASWQDCASLVCYYVQDCEVFDAPPK